jgi:membrane protease YdiL (CAAX protease family)
MIAAHELVAKPYRVVWPQLLAAVLSFLAYRFFVQKIEKRELKEFAAKGAVGQVLLGLLLGVGMVCAAFGLLATKGVYQLQGVAAITPLLFLPLAELMLVGLVEEMLFRGVVFGISERALGSRWAVIISALVFALGHLSNEGIALISVGALFADGVLQAALYIRTRRLWICIANHVAWNYGVGQLFSGIVSGHGAEHGLLQGKLVGPDWLTGGVFGVEGSLATLVVIGVVAAFALRGVVVKGLMLPRQR